MERESSIGEIEQKPQENVKITASLYSDMIFTKLVTSETICVPKDTSADELAVLIYSSFRHHIVEAKYLWIRKLNTKINKFRSLKLTPTDSVQDGNIFNVCTFTDDANKAKSVLFSIDELLKTELSDTEADSNQMQSNKILMRLNNAWSSNSNVNVLRTPFSKKKNLLLRLPKLEITCEADTPLFQAQVDTLHPSMSETQSTHVHPADNQPIPLCAPQPLIHSLIEPWMAMKIREETIQFSQISEPSSSPFDQNILQCTARKSLMRSISMILNSDNANSRPPLQSPVFQQVIPSPTEHCTRMEIKQEAIEYSQIPSELPPSPLLLHNSPMKDQAQTLSETDALEDDTTDSRSPSPTALGSVIPSLIEPWMRMKIAEVVPEHLHVHSHAYEFQNSSLPAYCNMTELEEKGK